MGSEMCIRDSYNIAQYFAMLGQSVTVWQNDQATIEDIATLAPDYLVIGPGPCTPDSAGISLSAIRTFAGQIPLLGICLGHQAIGQAFGGRVVRAHEVKHGRTSQVSHDGTGVFKDITSPFLVTRYHSLVLEPTSLPSCLTVNAWSSYDNGEFEAIMGVQHTELALAGVQFHPESILTAHGLKILDNFLRLKISVRFEKT